MAEEKKSLNFSWIKDTIALGEEPKAEHIPLLKSIGVHSLLDLRLKSEIPPRVQERMKEFFVYQNIPVEDGKTLPLDSIIRAVEFIEENLKRGKIYIHCQRGISRSPSVLMCYFISKGMAGDVAHNKIKSKRKRIWITHALLPSIFEFERYVASKAHPSKEVDYLAYERIIGQGYRKLGKFVYYILTHSKGNLRYKVPMDDAEFVKIDDILQILQTRYEYKKWVERETIFELVERSKRFEIHDEKIRMLLEHLLVTGFPD